MNRRLIAVAAGLIVLACTSCGNTSRTATDHPTEPATASTSGTTNSTTPYRAPTTAVSSPTPEPSYAPSGSLPPTFANISEVPATTGPGHSTADVTVIAANSADEAAMADAVGNPPSCVAKAVPSTIHIATVKHTGISWALAGFTRVSGCPVNPFFYRNPPPPVGVFERQPGGKWMFNSEDGKPFPCPEADDPEADNGSVSGEGSNYIPPEVFQAWQMPYYSSDCSTYVAPGLGQGH